MIRLFRRNPFLRRPVPVHLPLTSLNRIHNGTADLSPFTLPFFSSASNLPHQSQSPKITEPIIDFFHSYGFTDPQIESFIHRYPSVLSTETIKPKLEHLLAYGFSPSELVRTICFDPRILTSSLSDRIGPNLKLLEAIFISKPHTMKAIKLGPFLLVKNLEKRVIPNVKILREHSIPTDKIIRLFSMYPRVLAKNPNIIIESINKLMGLGMSPSTLPFIHGMNVMATYKKETWERKMGFYRSLGWSEEDTLSVFSSLPAILQLSNDKIKKQMDFLTDKLEWDSALVAKRAIILLYSLEDRIIPRCSVLNVLAKKKLWEGKPSLYSLLILAERNFKERFVDKYSKQVPQVIDAYQGKIDFLGFESMVVNGVKS